MKLEIRPVAKGATNGTFHAVEDHRLAYVPSLLRHLAEGEWRKCQNRSGALRHANSKSTLDVYTHAVKPFPLPSD